MNNLLGICFVVFVLSQKTSQLPLKEDDGFSDTDFGHEDAQEVRIKDEAFDLFDGNGASAARKRKGPEYLLVPLDSLLTANSSLALGDLLRKRSSGGAAVTSKEVRRKFSLDDADIAIWGNQGTVPGEEALDGLEYARSSPRASSFKPDDERLIISEPKACDSGCEKKPVNITLTVQNLVRSKAGKVCRLRVKNCSNVDDTGTFNFNVLIEEEPCPCPTTCPPKTCPTTTPCCPTTPPCFPPKPPCGGCGQGAAVEEDGVVSKGVEKKFKDWLDNLVLKCAVSEPVWNRSESSTMPDVYEINLMDTMGEPSRKPARPDQDQDMVKTIDLYVTKMANSSIKTAGPAGAALRQQQEPEAEPRVRPKSTLVESRSFLEHLLTVPSLGGESGPEKRVDWEAKTSSGLSEEGGSHQPSEGVFLRCLSEVMKRLSGGNGVNFTGGEFIEAPIPELQSAKLVVYPPDRSDLETSGSRTNELVHFRRMQPGEIH